MEGVTVLTPLFRKMFPLVCAEILSFSAITGTSLHCPYMNVHQKTFGGACNDVPGLESLFSAFMLLSYVALVDYLAFFLRVAKNRPAAIIIMAHPPTVKIVVPIPPVEGREEILVLGMFVAFPAAICPNSSFFTISP